MKKENLPSKIPIVDLTGEPYERGYKYGSECSKKIKNLVDGWFSYLSTNQFPNIALTKDQALSLTYKYLPYAKDYAPDLIEECRGIADGSNTKFEEIFAINCFLDMLDATFPQIRWKYLARGSSLKTYPFKNGCTTFAVSQKATQNNSDVISGQNYDLMRADIFQKAIVILRIKTKRHPNAVCLSFAGIIGCNGVNSSGIALVINKLVSIDSKPGVPYPFIVRKILQQKRIGTAIGSVISCERGSGAHYLITDKNGEIHGIECTTTEFEDLIPLDGVLGHSNHYASERLKKFELLAPYRPDTLVRWSRINKHLYANKGKITLENCKNWLKDHVNHPYSICAHDPKEGKTISGIIMCPKKSTILASYGNPCVQPFVKYVTP